MHDPAEHRKFFESLPPEDVDEMNRLDHIEHIRQVNAFRTAYKNNHCYLCDEQFDQIRKSKPCPHWLLRRCRFRKNEFEYIYSKYDYHNIAAFLRWCANEETLLHNINDLVEERSARKVLSYTIKWKNIEWTFDCTENDLAGHGRAHSSVPHYHFQMRIDGRPFIDFNDFHVPFSDRDLFTLSLRNEPWFHQNFGAAGSGMQDAISVDPDAIIELTQPTENAQEAPYQLSTIIEAIDNPITGEEFAAILEESKRTKKSFAAIAKLRLSGRANVQTVVSPNDSVPKISSRTEHKRRS